MIPKLILAPMAAVNCKAFRLLCLEYGADIVYTQMLYVKKVVECSDIKSFLGINEFDSNVVVQLIGSVNDPWEEAVKKVEPYVNIIDINFGCPESEALEKKCGSYLLNQPEQMRKIIRKVKVATKKSISAKIRSGWSENNAVMLSKLLEEEGIFAIAVHPRTKKQNYTGKADWTIIKDVKNSVNVLVYGNGDITLAGHAKSMFEQTKCDGIMIGREAMKNPAIFYDIKFLFLNNRNNPTPIHKFEQIKRFLELYLEVESEIKLGQVMDHCSWMVSDLDNAKELREKIRKCDSIESIRRLFV